MSIFFDGVVMRIDGGKDGDGESRVDDVIRGEFHAIYFL